MAAIFDYAALPPINNGSATKNSIISLLSAKYPLTKTKIYRELKKEGFSRGFHAINKAVNELHENGVINKKDNVYLPSYEWLKKVHDFSEYALSRLKNDKGFLIRGVKEIKKDGDIVTLTFGNLFDTDVYSKDLHNFYYSKLGKKDKVCMVYRHHWWHILYPCKEYPSKIKNKNFYCICTKNTTLDRSGMKFKRLLGMKVIYRRSHPLSGYSVYGDVIVQQITSPNIERALDNFFAKTKKVEDLACVRKFIDKVLKKEGKVMVIINKNPELASEIKSNIIASFKK